jgi:geranylgeranyl diphosphate synthase, type I
VKPFDQSALGLSLVPPEPASRPFTPASPRRPTGKTLPGRLSQTLSLHVVRVDPLEWLERIRLRIDERLERVLAEREARAAALAPETAVLVESIQDMTLRGGKRVRPALLVAGYCCVTDEPVSDEIIDASVAAELLQTCLLIQDDWMDRDDTRRGRPTVHAALAARYGDEHIGASVAILASTLASAFAWEALCSSGFPDARIRAALAAFYEMHELVAGGQLLDVTGEGSLETMHLLKTASYTVRGPLRIGAILGGATAEQLAALDGFARASGIAFQLRDDLLDSFGDAAATGKPLGSDLRAGRSSALIVDARIHAGPAERAAIDAVFGDPAASAEAVAAAIAALDRCGTRQRAEARIDALLAEALDCLAAAPLTETGTEILKGMAYLLVRRSR